MSHSHTAILLAILSVLLYAFPVYAQSEQGSFDPSSGISARNTFLYNQIRDVPNSLDPIDTHRDLSSVPAYNDDMDDTSGLETSPYQKLKQRLMEKGKIPESSALEGYYSKRIGQNITQFGYDIFTDMKPRSYLSRPVIGVQDDYVLGVGDSLIVTFLGERSDRELYKVNQDGQVVITELEPIVAAGRNISDFRDELNAILEQSYHGTKAFVSVERIKDVSFSVIGEVQKPGHYTLSAQSGILDVLSAAKGIKKSGSLRRIKRIRGGQSVEIDLYDMLIGGKALPDLSLRDGDRIIIPAIGPTLAVIGEVQRPAIYELSTKTLSDPKLSLEEALSYAGGALVKSQSRFMRASTNRDGGEVVTQILGGKSALLSAHDVIRVEHQDSLQRDGVTLRGAVRNEGLHSLNDVPSLSKLLGNKALFMPNIYPFLGVIKRFDPKSLASKLVAFSPKNVVEGVKDYPLQDLDEVLLFSREDITAALYDAKKDKNTSKEELERIEQGDRSLLLSKEKPEALPEPLINEQIKAFIKNYALSLKGEVLYPGLYPVAEKTDLQALLDYAGGISIEADPNRIEVTNALTTYLTDGEEMHSGRAKRLWVNLDLRDAAEVMLFANDTIRVHKAFSDLSGGDQTVRITGEVLYPGYYDLARGESLFDLINRAGGLTDIAYPDGAIFSRERERERERQEFTNQAIEIERGIAAALDNEEIKDDQIRFMKATVEKLKDLKPTGRITVEANPDILRGKPDQNILLEPGDYIHIPKRSITVRVTGEVLSPAVLQFKDTKEAIDYIKEAGGYTRNADRGKAYVIYPDGSAQPLSLGAWQSSASASIPPMSTIYIPRDPKPFDFLQTGRDFTQILTNLAITGIFLDDITDDN